MFIYTGLFVASFISALLAHFLYKAITNKYRSIQISNRRIAITDGASRYKKEGTGFMTYGGLPNQSVQEGGVVSSIPRKTHLTKPVVCHNQNTARLVGEKRHLSMNGSYKVSRKETSERPTLEMVSKPFRRKVEPWAKDNKIAIRPWETQEHRKQ